MKKGNCLIFITLLFLLSGCNQTPDQPTNSQIHISAASSLTAPLDRIKELFEEEHPNRELIINYGSSGTLVNQLEQGAPADLIILADTSWMLRAIEQKIASEAEVEQILSNRLVLAAPPGSPLGSIDGLKKEGIEKIAIGDPASVPVGTYTKQALTQLGEWESLSKKAVMAKSARQVAVYLESGNVEAGFIFQSDLETFTGLEEVEMIPASLHDPIVYPAAPVSRAGNEEGGEMFLDFLTSEDATAVFLEYGFEEIR